MTTEPKKKRGRPPTRTMPERIDATPEEIADVVMRAPPKTKWRYLEGDEKGTQRGAGDARK